MMLVKKIGLAVSLGLVSSFVVADNVYDLGELELKVRLSDGDISTKLISDYITTGVSGFFEDTFIFTTPKLPEGSMWWPFSLAESDYLSVGVTGITEFYNIRLLGENVDESGYTWDPSTPTAVIHGGEEPDVFLIMPERVYSIKVSGDSRDELSGYSFILSLNQVSPVPEPSSIALMLGGLGLVGFMAARRRNEHSLKSHR